MAQYFNITTALTQELIAAGNNTRVSSAQLVNIHATDSVNIDLYIEKKLTGRFYLIKDVNLPIGATLIHDKVSFSTAEGGFGLYIKLTKSASETPAVDVIIS